MSVFNPYKRAWEALTTRPVDQPWTNDAFKKIITSLPRKDRHVWEAMKTLYRMDAAKFNAFAEDKPWLYLMVGADVVKKKLNIDVPYGSPPKKNKQKYEPKHPKVKATAEAPAPVAKAESTKHVPMSQDAIVELMTGLNQP